MKIEGLPDSHQVTVSASIDVLKVALQSVFGDSSPISHVISVYGEPQTIYVLCDLVYANTVKLPRSLFSVPLSIWQAANILNRLSVGTRCDPRKKSGRVVKGWEIRRADVEGGKIAIALAHWVSY